MGGIIIDNGLSVIIVDYNTINKTIEYIKECQKYLINASKVYFIVDNGNHIENVAFLNNIYNEAKKIQCGNYEVNIFNNDGIDIYYVYSGGNIGYAKGNNIGAIISHELFPQNQLLISNNDLVYTEKVDLSVVLELLKNNAVVAPDIVAGEKHLNPKSIDSLTYNLYGQYIKKRRVNYDQYTFMGAFWFFNTSQFLDVEGFDENTFLYFEEYILAARMREKKYNMYYYPNVVIIHNHEYKDHSLRINVRLRREFFKSAIYYEREYNNMSRVQELVARVFFYLTLYSVYVPLRVLFKF